MSQIILSPMFRTLSSRSKYYPTFPKYSSCNKIQMYWPHWPGKEKVSKFDTKKVTKEEMLDSGYGFLM